VYSAQLQDWLTIYSEASVLTVTQSEPCWLATDAYRDIVFWLEVRDVTTGGGTVKLVYETSPTKDEVFFGAMATALTLAPSATPVLTPIIESLSPTLPLCTWVRWRLLVTSPASRWGATFRIHCALNPNGAA
jgi:hypothetical protein